MTTNIKVTGLALLSGSDTLQIVKYKVSVLDYLNTLHGEFAYTKTEILNDIAQDIKNHNPQLVLNCDNYEYNHSSSTNSQLVLAYK